MLIRMHRSVNVECLSPWNTYTHTHTTHTHHQNKMLLWYVPYTCYVLQMQKWVTSCFLFAILGFFWFLPRLFFFQILLVLHLHVLGGPSTPAGPPSGALTLYITTLNVTYVCTFFPRVIPVFEWSHTIILPSVLSHCQYGGFLMSLYVGFLEDIDGS